MKTKQPKVIKLLGVLLIWIALLYLNGCAKNERRQRLGLPSGVCVIKTDWTDPALDNLNDHNKKVILIYSTACEGVENAGNGEKEGNKNG